ncbi:MAG TPA: glycosyltransferase family 2 protein [Casimicrobiaceae bacterium]|nr:glycosyltransferase family 2 protein [Casimicrobiaceae bacterium]
MTGGEVFPGRRPRDGASSPSDFLSIVVPAHNEASGIAHAVEAISGVLASGAMRFEIIVVDDGSRDQTFERVRALAAADVRVKGVRFTRNFGKEAALLAGLRAASGAAVVTIDADLQHPPALIPQMIQEWRAGAMVVDAVKRDRATDGALTRGRARLFNALLSRLGGINLKNASDFKLLDRVVVDAITRELPERQRFYRGLADWVGYRHASIPFDVAARADGEGKWSLLKLFSLATTAIVSFTSAPLQIVTVLGFATLAFGFFVGADALIAWFQGRAVSGFATTIITLLIVGSFIMISLGIIGEYIAKIYDEIKARPPYLVETEVGFEQQEAQRAGRAARPLAELLEPRRDS